MTGSRGPLPIVIGATGHRDLPRDAESIAKLEAAVDGILECLEAESPHAPIVVVSALADGADQLVARVARRRGLKLLVPLPMPRAIYEATIADKEQFGKLAEDADVFELPLAGEATAASLAADLRAQARQYGVLAAFLARQCHGLIALWDGLGTDEPLEGGTAQVVSFHRDGVPVPLMPPQYPPDPVDLGPTWHVVTPRSGQARPPGAFEVRDVLPGHASQSSARKLYAGIRDRVDAFDADALGQGPVQPGESDLAPADELSRLPRHVQATAARQALAERIATRCQHDVLAALATLPWMAAVAVVSLQIYADWSASIGWLTTYVVAIGAAWLYFWWVLARRRTQDRFQDYRALAEGLRVEFYRQASGAEGSAADHYLGRQRSELDWIRQALRAWTLVTPEARAALLGRRSAPDRATLELARDRWVASQAAYYASAARRDRTRLHRWERLRGAALGLSLVVALAAALLVPAAPEGSWLHEAFNRGSGEASHAAELAHAALVTLIALPAVVAGFIEYYIGRRALAEHARRYERMAQDFALMRGRLDALLREDRLDEARSLLMQVASMALAEHGDWVALHRERPIDVPQGG